jgi:hypothetical protein
MDGALVVAGVPSTHLRQFTRFADLLHQTHFDFITMTILNSKPTLLETSINLNLKRLFISWKVIPGK